MLFVSAVKVLPARRGRSSALAVGGTGVTVPALPSDSSGNGALVNVTLETIIES
jgi:hypothetical protein